MLRRRHALTIAVLLCALTPGTTRAADKSPYAVTATATRSPKGQILASITLSHTSKQDVPGIGPTDVTSKQTAPKVLLPDGQRALIAIGNAARPDATPDAIESGYKIDVINVKGQDHLLLVTTVIDNAVVIWADATTIPITPAAPTSK